MRLAKPLVFDRKTRIAPLPIRFDPFLQAGEVVAVEAALASHRDVDLHGKVSGAEFRHLGMNRSNVFMAFRGGILCCLLSIAQDARTSFVCEFKLRQYREQRL